jgi:hypothetical protein
MKKLIASIALAFAVALPVQAQAATYWSYGVLYGNVCRAGHYYIILPFAPVGTLCYIDYAGVRFGGQITSE